MEEFWQKLDEFLFDYISLSDFYRWVMVETWEVDEPVIHEVCLLFAEWTSGHRTPEEVREKLREIVMR